MCRILVVDDEPIAIESIIYMINKNLNALQVVGSSRTGKDAIEKAFNLHPDIIIMDINMPGINGLDAMKQIRSGNPTVRFIVISAFDYFDYAVESVALGVAEYLLKPVKEAKLIETLNKVVEQINQSKMDMKNKLDQQERLEMVIPILETGFINSLCNYGEDSIELQKYCDLLGYKNTSGYVMAIEFRQKNTDKMENKYIDLIRSQKFYSEVKKVIYSACLSIIGPIVHNRIIIYVFDEWNDDYTQNNGNSNYLANKIIHKTTEIYEDVYIGIGKKHKDLKDAKKSYQEALDALRLLFKSEIKKEKYQNNVLHVEDILEKEEKKEKVECNYEHFIEEEIYSKISSKEEKLIQISFQQLFTRMSTDANIDFSTLKKRMIDMVVGFDKRWGSIINDYYDTLNEIVCATNEEILFQICKNFINDAIQKISAGKHDKVNSIIKKADQYIYEHFAEEISLEDIAKAVNLSPFYFSRFYKEETGYNFSEKLVQVRIEKAKELLKRDDLSIKDVCYQVGYMEPNYFSKIFKKVTGFTASDYKKLIGT